VIPVVDHFDLLAPIYDRAIPFSQLEPMLRFAALPADVLLLDAGGGTGRVAAALRPYVREVLVVDASFGMLRQARRKGLTSVVAPAEQLPFADATFERIIMVDTLHHVAHQGETVRELWRVLRPGGRLVIEEPDVRDWRVKLVALAEKLALMRSHFLSPPTISAMFPAEARVAIETERWNAWLIVEK
jgi:demethylmenaquinone methyltransferase/2-methoxy-6-polyprenyl-1,4-benzoquinol methylase